MKTILSFLFITIILSCNVKQQAIPSQSEQSKTPVREITLSKKIRFDFTAERNAGYRDYVTVYGTLYNDETDTVHFLSTTCDGDQYSLRFDTSKFELTPLRFCNATFPAKQKIAPKGRYSFKANFTVKREEKKIVLGFDFFQVDQSFIIDSYHWTSIHNRKTQEQNVIWAHEKQIRQ